MSTSENKMGRREALKWLAGASAATALAPTALAQGATTAEVVTRSATDPNLVKPVIAWKGLLSESELKTLTALCDMILPQEDQSPSASQVGVPAFINEWVSASYPIQQADKLTIRGGLAWLNIESLRRTEKEFADLTEAEKTGICDDIAYLPKTKPEFIIGAIFFAKVRDLSATGFYTTTQGMKDLGYIGNVPLAKFDGPPPEVLKHMGLA